MDNEELICSTLTMRGKAQLRVPDVGYIVMSNDLYTSTNIK